MENSIFCTQASLNGLMGCPPSAQPVPAPTLSYHNISYSVNTKDFGRFCGSRKVEVLKQMSGIFKPGLNAILGATGSGKSSLLDVLTTRRTDGVDGVVLMDGKKLPADFYREIGYVTQEDMLMGTLTVRENLAFSAALRLAGSKEEKQASVDKIISQLELTKCADSKVGDEWLRGVSGGERRRTNIAMEMLKQPRILFLDEPTSGLDAHTAFSVVSTLHRLALEGRTIILSIHQPRYAIFKLFHSLTILMHGQTVFHGPCSQSLPYFNSIGYLCEQHDNPSDFFLDAITKEVPTEDSSFSDSFRQSQYNKTLMVELQEVDERGRSEEEDTKRLPMHSYATGFLTQVEHLARRSLLNLTRSYHVVALQMLTTMVFAVVIGLLFLQINTKYLSLEVSLQNRTGALFYLLVNQVFMTVSEVDTFMRDRKVFWYEHSKGYYRTSSYFVTKVLFDSLLPRLFCVLLYAIVSYLLIGFDFTLGRFTTYLYSLLMLATTCSCFCYLVGSFFSSPSAAQTVVSFFFVAMALMSGFLVNLASMEGWMAWLSHFSILKYALNVNYIMQLKNLVITVANGTDTYLDSHSATERLDMLAIKHTDLSHLWTNLLALHLYAFLLLAATYATLRRTNKHT